MSDKPIKISFTLAPEDVRYFRRLIKSAKKQASDGSPASVIRKVRGTVEEVRGKSVPQFVRDAVVVLEDLIAMYEDEAWNMPKGESDRVLAALTYFANPADIIPDHIPGVGFLDDAIMIRIVESEFKNELWGYRKFRAFREGAEQRPWTAVAQDRLPRRLAEKRKQLRAQIKVKNASGGGGWFSPRR